MLGVLTNLEFWVRGENVEGVPIPRWAVLIIFSIDTVGFEAMTSIS